MSLSKSKVDWEELLPELLAAIAKRLTSTLDYTSFRGVCKSWRSAATFDNFDHTFPQVPWLRFTAWQDKEEKRSDTAYVTKFLDLSKNKKTFRIANLPKVDEKSISYYLCCRGWLLGVAESSVNAYLTHPIRGTRIMLPDLDTFPRYTTCRYLFNLLIKKMVLSGSPTIASDLVIAVIWGKEKQLAFSRPGDSSWTSMEPWDGSFEDILYHNEKLYAIDDKLRVVECDIRSPNPTRIQQILSIQDFYTAYYLRGDCYMAESSGKFIIVSAYRFLFQVFEFDIMNGTHKEIHHDLGNRTLFLSENSSSLCLGQDFAWNDEVQPNSIYFAESGISINMCIFYPKRFVRQDFHRVQVLFPTWVVPGF